MAEYIERENYCENVCHCANEYCDKESCPIWKAPVADVAPVWHGRWDDSYDGITPYCTVCGCSHRLMVRTPKYCPNCGAKMDGGDENG